MKEMPRSVFRFNHTSYVQNAYLGWYSFQGWWAYGTGRDRPYEGLGI